MITTSPDTLSVTGGCLRFCTRAVLEGGLASNTLSQTAVSADVLYSLIDASILVASLGLLQIVFWNSSKWKHWKVRFVL